MIDETTAIAQLVERTAFNRVVEGSSPSGGVDEDSRMKTKSTLQQSLPEADPQAICGWLMKASMPERSKGVVLSTTVFALVGSNPTARILIFSTATSNFLL